MADWLTESAIYINVYLDFFVYFVSCHRHFIIHSQEWKVKFKTQMLLLLDLVRLKEIKWMVLTDKHRVSEWVTESLTSLVPE